MNAIIIRKILFALKQFVKMFVQNMYLPLVYNIYKHKKVIPNLAIFADAHNDVLPLSMLNMRNEMRKKGYLVMDFFMDYQKNSFLSVFTHMTRFMKFYAQAKYVFICDYFLPVSSGKKREETKVVQLWHSSGTLKKFGYSTEDDIPIYYKGNLFKNYDLITVSSPECIRAFANAMNCSEETILSTGVSRTDIYFNRDYSNYCRVKFAEYYPELVGKKIVLWSPTFRGPASQPYVVGQEAIKHLEQKLGDEWCVITRLHPHLSKILDIKYDITTDDLLPVIDILITDYSSIVFDYSLFLKPLVLFAPDYFEYSDKRGFYLNYLADIPASIATNECDLLQAVLKCEEEFDKAKMQKFKDTYMSSCDGRSTERILNVMT